MNVIDLFCGMKGWSNPFKEAGHNVWTTDIDPKFKPNLAKDILDIQADHTPFGQVDILFASPPCETFSVASIGTHWTGGKRAYVPKTAAAHNGMELVRKTLSLIEEIHPRYAIIENPRGVLRNLGIIPVEPVTIWQCHYGRPIAKPTDLWGLPFPEDWKPEPVCHNRRPTHIEGCCCFDHEAAPRGAKTGTQGVGNYALRSEIPLGLAHSFLEALS